MKTYYIDTNVLLRYILKDNLIYWNKAMDYIKSAKNQTIKIVLIPEVIIEVEYVLRKKYNQDRVFNAKCLYYFIQSSYISVPDRAVFQKALLLYLKTNIDLVDICLFLMAKTNNAEVLSFDKDFNKLQKLK